MVCHSVYRLSSYGRSSSLWSSSWSPLDFLKQLHVLLTLGTPELHTVLILGQQAEVIFARTPCLKQDILSVLTR